MKTIEYAEHGTPIPDYLVEKHAREFLLDKMDNVVLLRKNNKIKELQAQLKRYE